MKGFTCSLFFFATVLSCSYGAVIHISVEDCCECKDATEVDVAADTALTPEITNSTESEPQDLIEPRQEQDPIESVPVGNHEGGSNSPYQPRNFPALNSGYMPNHMYPSNQGMAPAYNPYSPPSYPNFPQYPLNHNNYPSYQNFPSAPNFPMFPSLLGNPHQTNPLSNLFPQMNSPNFDMTHPSMYGPKIPGHFQQRIDLEPEERTAETEETDASNDLASEDKSA